MRATISVREVGDAILVELALPMRPTEQIASITQAAVCSDGDLWAVEFADGRQVELQTSATKAMHYVVGSLTARIAAALQPEKP